MQFETPLILADRMSDAPKSSKRSCDVFKINNLDKPRACNAHPIELNISIGAKVWAIGSR